MKTGNRILSLSIPLLALLVALSGCGKGGGPADAKANAAIQSKLEVIRQAGQPLTAAELNAWYAEPPAGENAAPLYAEAFAALAVEDAQSPLFLAKNQQALGRLHQAAAKRQCRYPVDLTEGFNAKLPHLAKLRICAQLLGKDAVSNAGKGRLDLATQSLTDGLRLARSLDREPLLISQLVRVACDAIIQSSLEEAVTLKAFPEDQLARLQAAFREEAVAVEGCFARALTGERCATVAFFQLSPQDYERLNANAGTNSLLGTRAAFERYRKSASFNADFNLCLDLLSNGLAIASAPFPACLDAAGEWDPQAADLINEAKNKGYRVTAQMLQALKPQLEKVADRVGQLRTAEAALAVERYRLAHPSTLPDSLSQLVPQFLDTAPADPFDGKPLHFKKLSPKGYVVYSIGRNRQDDGGAPKPSGSKAEGPYDVTFAVRR